VFPGFAQRLEISGTDGTVVVEDGQLAHLGLRTELHEFGLRGSRAGLGAAVPGAAVSAAAIGISSHVAQLADLLAAVDEGRPPAVTAANGRETLEVICAVYESAREGRSVVLPAAP
jgi:UDP-N-acetyl-2-amino-2-deoxyglucuronate dehydrogenase